MNCSSQHRPIFSDQLILSDYYIIAKNIIFSVEKCKHKNHTLKMTEDLQTSQKYQVEPLS